MEEHLWTEGIVNDLNINEKEALSAENFPVSENENFYILDLFEVRRTVKLQENQTE